MYVEDYIIKERKFFIDTTSEEDAYGFIQNYIKEAEKRYGMISYSLGCEDRYSVTVKTEWSERKWIDLNKENVE